MERSQDYKVQVNAEFEFEGIDLSRLDAVDTQDRTFHILKDGKSFQAELVEADFAGKELSIRVNGTLYKVALQDPYDQLVRNLGLAAVSAQVVREIKAPMPGMVLDIGVKEGQSVSKGETLLILEAMKMENVLKAVGEGVVKKIFVEKGKAVEKNQLLIEME